MTRDKVLQEIRTTKNLVRWEIDGVNLGGVDFTGVNLEKAIFRDCRLCGARFDNADLCGATFERCRLKRASFRHARMQQARFTRGAGLRPGDIAWLEKEGAIVEQPAGRSSMIWVVLVLALAAVGAAVFYLGRDYDSTPAPDATSAPAATPVTATPAAPSLTQLEEQAKAAFTAADYAKAAELWGQATAQKANDVDLLISYARALLLSGQFDAFPALAEKILSLASTPDQTLDGQLLLAGAQVYKGDLAAGTALYEKMLAERKDAKRDHRTILLEQGTTLWRTKHYDKALVTFQKALPVSEPDQRAGLWVNMALVYRDMGKIDGETNAYRRAYQDANAPPDVRAGAKIELALIDLRQGRVDKAKQQIAESVRENLNPGQVVTALRDVAKVLADKKRCDDIKPLYQPLLEALAKDPGPLNDARVDLANVLVTCGNSAEALSLYKQVATESTNKIQKDWATETAREMAASPPATTP